MTYAAAVSELPGAVAAANEAADRVADEIGSGPDVAIVFVTADHRDDLEHVSAAIEQRLGPKLLVGATAVSVLANAREVESAPAVSLWAASDADVRARRLTATSGPGTGVGVAGLDMAELEVDDTLVLVPDPFSFPVSGLVDRLTVDRPDVTVVGGLASAGMAPGGNRILVDGEVFSDGAVGLIVGARTRVSTVVSQGCRPIGEPMVVTRGEGNALVELAGRPAYRQLVELLQQLDDRDRDLVTTGLHIGWVIDEHKVRFERGDFLIRAVLGADEGSGVVAVGDEIPVGSVVQFQVRDAASADDDLRNLMQGRSAAGALVFTCNGRGTQLFDAPDHDAALVSRALSGAPLAGMFCAGEIGPVGARTFLHGYTASVALFED